MSTQQLADFLATATPLAASYAIYRLWLWSDKRNTDDPARRHRPL